MGIRILPSPILPKALIVHGQEPQEASLLPKSLSKSWQLGTEWVPGFSDVSYCPKCLRKNEFLAVLSVFH